MTAAQYLDRYALHGGHMAEEIQMVRDLKAERDELFAALEEVMRTRYSGSKAAAAACAVAQAVIAKARGGAL